MDKDLKEILNRIKFLKEDFEMLQDGRWSLNYDDGSGLDASLINCDMHGRHKAKSKDT